MEKRIISFEYDILDRDELSQEEMADLKSAAQAREFAHAPYSNFAVGALIRTKDGKTYPGWNVENVVYNVLHAEEAALGRISRKSRRSGLERITVVGGPEGDCNCSNVVTPCGLCRQKLLELVLPDDDPQVIMAGVRGRVERVGLRSLLPLAFYPALLK